jgi:hypothetical protein
MSTIPEHDPLDTQDSPTRGEQSSSEHFAPAVSSETPLEDPRGPDHTADYPEFPATYNEEDAPRSEELPLVEEAPTEPVMPAPLMPDEEAYAERTLHLVPSWEGPQLRRVARVPNLGHLLILAALVVLGWMCAGVLTLSALHFNLFGISTIQKAITDIHYTLGSMIVVYLVAFIASLIVFPMLWDKGFFAGVQWNGEAALRLRWRLFGAAFVCFLFALLNGVLMPGPENAPIDKIFRAPGAAWLLFGFGITAAPFFEELFFRGFLLPTLCTAFDWTSEKINSVPGLPPDADGHPHWSLAAMAASSVLTSIPFALLHAEQTGYSLGPFVLLVCVSLVLCWARLSTRSLAASVLVHASYNCLLFSVMLLGTGGFQHLDKM